MLRQLKVLFLITSIVFTLIVPAFAQSPQPATPTQADVANLLYLPVARAGESQAVAAPDEQDFTDADFTDPESEAATAASSEKVGAVFVASNAFDPVRGNEVTMFRRATDGTLTLLGRFPTGGQGSGPGTRFRADGLGSAGSVTLSKNHQWLFVTNAGDNRLSVFRVLRYGLELRAMVDSGGLFPNSVTVRKNIVYVLHAANEGSITGFKMDGHGQLTPLADSTRSLNAHQTFPPDALFNPAGIRFTADGDQLIVTIKDGPPIPEATGKGRILVFNMRHNLPSNTPVVYEGNNNGPFGFDLDPKGHLLVADFVGGANHATGAASSYQIDEDGSLSVISNNVEDTQIDTCWLVTNSRYAYGSNFSSDTLSSWQVDDDGNLTLLNATAGHTDVAVAFPLDLGITSNGKFLYLIQPGNGKVGMWAINDDGSLTSLGAASGLEPSPTTEPAAYFTHAGGSPAGIAAY